MSEAACVGLVTFITMAYGVGGLFWTVLYADPERRLHQVLVHVWVYTLILWLLFIAALGNHVCPPGLN